jgi:glycosyltransferase involved in cell wall biosynthesis
VTKGGAAGTPPDTWMIVPASPERLDGVRDFAAHLAAALETHGPVMSFTTAGDCAPAPGTTVLPGWRALEARFRAPRAACVNYVPQSWLRRDLPAVLARLSEARAAGTRVILIVHEYQLDPAPSIKRAAARVVFRRMARVFASRADAVVTTHGFVAGLARADGLDRRSTLATIPVGSNIPEPRAPAATGPAARIVMFGQPAGMAPAMTAAAARAAAERGAELVWICRRQEEAIAWMARHGITPASIRLAAGQDGAAVSRELSAAAVGFAPNDDGVSTRRTTVAALLQHGLPVVGSDGRATDPLLRDSGAFVLAPAADGAAAAAAIGALLADAGRRERMGAAARALFDEHLAWPRIAAQYRRLGGLT